MALAQEFEELPAGPSLQYDTYLLGSKLSSESLVVDGRCVNWRGNFSGPAERASSRIYKITSSLGLSQIVHAEALGLWKRARKKGLVRGSALRYLVWVAARIHGEDADALHLEAKKPKRFIYRAHVLALELDVDLQATDRERDLLRVVDQLGLPRDFFRQVKALYPKARRIRGGDPRTTMGALIYHLTSNTRRYSGLEEQHRKMRELRDQGFVYRDIARKMTEGGAPKTYYKPAWHLQGESRCLVGDGQLGLVRRGGRITQRQIAASMGMSEYAIREAYCQLMKGGLEEWTSRAQASKLIGA